MASRGNLRAMEKLIYLLWKSPDQTIANFRDNTLTRLSVQFSQAGASAMRLAVADHDVDAAKDKRIVCAATQSTGAPDALLSFWLPSASTRGPIESCLNENCRAINGYLVTESEPLANKEINTTINTATRPQHGQRIEGMNQVVLLRRPSRLSREEWLDLWLNQHTPIAIATQSTFGYRQNVVTRILTNDEQTQTLALDAIVEENFPAAAMTSAHAFYKAINAEGKPDDSVLRHNQKAMFASVMRFIDLDQLDCLPMSAYLLE